VILPLLEAVAQCGKPNHAPSGVNGSTTASMLIPGEVARESGMISPTNPI
jgi:hypothetical protein